MTRLENIETMARKENRTEPPSSDDAVARELAGVREALAAEHRQLAEAQALAKIGSWVLDCASGTVLLSEENCRIFGLPADRQLVSRQDIDSHIHPDDREAVHSIFRNAREGHGPYSLDHRLLLADGSVKWVHARCAFTYDDHGNAIRAVGTTQDITDRKEAMQALSESNERFRLVTQATNDVIWDWDLLNDVCWWSCGLNTQLGFRWDESEKPDFWSRNIHPADRDRVLEGVRSCIESRELWTDEYRFRRADGTYARVFDRGVVATDEHGRPWRMVGTMVDITQKRLLEAQLEQVQRVATLGQLAANMAHEFNNVLMGIQPFVEVIRRVTQSLPKAQDATQHILESVQRGKRITDEMLRFTRQVDPVLRPMPVSDLLDRFQKSATSLVGDALRIVVVPCNDALVIDGDVEQLDQVLRSLLVNARDASPAGATVVVSARRTEQLTLDGGRRPAIEISLQDFGLGMDSKTASRVFDPLFTTKKGATGLGLTISHQIVGKHDGSLTVESTLGEGTTFHVVLPASRAATKPEASAVDGKRLLPSKILIVEDELAVAEGLAMLLAVEGVKCTAITEGAATMAAIERDEPDLVLLDIGLPDISGLDVFAELQSRWPHLPVILMTGHYSKSELTTTLKFQHVGFLQKPFEIRELLDLLVTCTAGQDPQAIVP